MCKYSLIFYRKCSKTIQKKIFLDNRNFVQISIKIRTNNQFNRNLVQISAKIRINICIIQKNDIKGKRYFESIKKYYSVDIGLRNARLNFRQQEPSHIMENIVYNHLRIYGYLVDVGEVEVREMKDGKQQKVQYEVDFIATNGQEKYYIQSAYQMDDETKREQELNSLKRIDDSFRKIVIVGDDIAPWMDDRGIAYIGLFQFLKEGLPK